MAEKNKDRTASAQQAQNYFTYVVVFMMIQDLLIDDTSLFIVVENMAEC